MPEALTKAEPSPPMRRFVGQLIIDIDRQKVHQMLAGLVDNALTYGPEASVDVRARVDGRLLLLSVVDDGPGMSDEDAGRVFDRFYRGDTSRSRLTGGNGLGLAIAKVVAERHGGEITLTTAPGNGCDFTIRLPLPPPA